MSDRKFNLPPIDYNVYAKKPGPGETGIPAIDAANRLNKLLCKDALTGCYSRNYYENYKTEIFDPNRDHNQVGLIFVDVNGLKKINDTKGHKAGDDLIKKTADFLKSSCRKEDMVFRIGGDEFVIICRNHNNHTNFEEDLYVNFEERRFSKAPTDFAFGVAVFDKSRDLDLSGTEKRADIAMYENKAEMKMAE